MAGKFEAFVDADSFFRFRLLAPDGAVIATSGPFEDKAAVVAGIAAVRECAGTGLVTDLCPAGALSRPAPVPAGAAAAIPVELPAAVVPVCTEERTPATVHAFVLAGVPRRHGTVPRWTRTATR
ncbi:YegP family protein [Pseudarthrobacter sp. NPDC058119]|uniref:YegP family protein n=1 Tax=Pseudarthrobacter sp. NPDC058119 TaxID=3346348 RepID=UPI0036DCD0B2